MHHRVGNLNARWKGIKYDAANFGFKNSNEISRALQIVLRAVNACGEVPVKLLSRR